MTIEELYEEGIPQEHGWNREEAEAFLKWYNEKGKFEHSFLGQMQKLNRARHITSKRSFKHYYGS